MGYGWNVTGSATPTTSSSWNGPSRLSRDHDRPTLIIVDSHIAWGSPHKQDTHAAHGVPLGEDEVRLTKKFYGWPEDAKFLVPDSVYDHFKAGHRQARQGASRRLVCTARAVPGKVPGARPEPRSRCSTVSFPRAGTKTCPRIRRTPRDSPRARRRAKCSMLWPRTTPG